MKEERRGARWLCELVHVSAWGEEGAKHAELKVTIALGVEAIFLAALLLDALCGGTLKEHGIHPRELAGLPGIFFAPFLHKNLVHLLTNCVPFFVLSMLVLLRERGISTYFVLTFLTILFAGTMVWTLGASGSNHIGSSGLVFSYFGFVVVSAVFKRNVRDFVIGVVVFVLYSSIFWGILPVDERISWEAHLFGLATGAAFGFIDAELAAADQKRPAPASPPPPPDAPAQGDSSSAEAPTERDALLP